MAVSLIRLMPRHGGLALAADIRATLAASESPLQSPQLALGSLREVRSVDGLAVAQRDERREADVLKVFLCYSSRAAARFSRSGVIPTIVDERAFWVGVVEPEVSELE